LENEKMKKIAIFTPKPPTSKVDLCFFQLWIAVTKFKVFYMPFLKPAWSEENKKV
jgi:hypothetical protein